MEHELLGVFLSSTPFDDLNPEDRTRLFADSERLLSGQPGLYTVAAILMASRTTKTRASGDEMAFLTLDTEVSTIEGVCFPRSGPRSRPECSTVSSASSSWKSRTPTRALSSRNTCQFTRSTAHAPEGQEDLHPAHEPEGIPSGPGEEYGTQLVRQDEEVVLDFIPTGVSGLDVALGGGWARGRYHQVIGQPNCCKTSMVLIAMANALEMYPDQGVSYIDVERTVTEERFLSHGVDPKDPRFFWRKPESGEDVADMLRDDLRTGLFSVAAIDSVGAMERGEALYEKTANESTMGKAAQLLTRMSKQITTIASDTNTAAFIVNQYRKNFEGGMDQAAGPMIMGYMTTDSVVMRRMYGAENVLTVKTDGDDIEVATRSRPA
jgi:RecA/RadA recombinase